MFAITDRAGEVLKRILEQHPDKNQCIRLDLSSLREGLRVDREMLGDEVVLYEGKRVLTIDPYTAETCARRTLDCDGWRFILLGPNW